MPTPQPRRRPPPGPRVLIVNTRARHGGRQLEIVRRELESRGVRLAAVFPVDAPERLARVVAEAVRSGARTLIVGGGDGTFSTVANALAGSDTILGALPLGTGNDFARSLGVPFRLGEACAVVARGRLAKVDLGRAGERFFINAASIGVTSEMTVSLRQRPGLKKGLGRLAYPTVALGKALAKRAFTVGLETDGARLTLQALEVVVGNGRYHGAGLIIAPEANLRDHVLDLYAILSGHEPGQLWRDLLVLARVAKGLRAGRHVADPLVLHMRTRQVRLEASPGQALDLDGELRGRTPVLLECVPDALRVILPA